MGNRSEHFSDHEFRCKCGQCVPVLPPDELIDALQDLRDHFGEPVTVHSGHRCERYNRRVGGASRSKHMKGIASDVTVKGIDNNSVQKYLLAKYRGRYGIGRYNTFTHLDVRPGPARWDNRR